MVRGKLTFICGGARSGKSAFAEKLLTDEANTHFGRLVYVATGRATDQEMVARIQQHQRDRQGDAWITFEQPTRLPSLLSSIQAGDYVLLDCVTTWLANELFAGYEKHHSCFQMKGCMDEKWTAFRFFCEQVRSRVNHFVIVSNEVLDDWPFCDEVTNLYCRWIGDIHCELVRLADQAIELDYGVPIYWKNGRGDGVCEGLW